jgi:ATP-dependent Clp endopeptidase proteolytic subunit ClpP
MSELRDERLRAEIENLNALTEAQRLENRRMKHDVDSELATSLANRVCPFFMPVTKGTVGDCILQLENWFRQDPDQPILLDFYSPGGDVFAGFALFDRIRSLQKRGARIDTKATGFAASMGAILLQAGNERIASPNSFIMVHEISSDLEGTMKELEDQTIFLKRLQEMAEDILLERTSLTRPQLRKRWARKDCWLNAREALELGLIDRIEE